MKYTTLPSPEKLEQCRNEFVMVRQEEIIKNAEELTQANKEVAELKKKLETAKKWDDFESSNNEKLNKKIEQYREALEFYADENTHKEGEVNWTKIPNICSVSKRELAPIELDLGEKARVCLKGEGK